MGGDEGTYPAPPVLHKVRMARTFTPPPSPPPENQKYDCSVTVLSPREGASLPVRE